MNPRAGLNNTPTSRPLPELQPLFELDHDHSLVVLKRRVPHLFGPTRSSRRSKRTVRMSLQSRPDPSLQGGTSPSVAGRLSRTTASAIADDVHRVRSALATVATQVSGGNSPASSSAPLSTHPFTHDKTADLYSVLLLVEQLSAKTVPGNEEWVQGWQNVLARIKDVYAKVIKPLQPNSSPPEDEFRPFNTDVMECIKAQVPTYIHYIRSNPTFDEDSDLVNRLQTTHLSLQKSAAGDATQREQVSELIVTILDAMRADMTAVSMSISVLDVNFSQIALAENLLGTNVDSFVEWSSSDSSWADEDSRTESTSSIRGSDVLPRDLAAPQTSQSGRGTSPVSCSPLSAPVATYLGTGEESRAQPDSSPSMELTGVVPARLGTGENSRAHSDGGSFDMELTGVVPGRQIVRPSVATASPVHSANTLPHMDASRSPTGDVPPIASTGSSPAREARGMSGRSPSPHHHNSPTASATEARGAGTNSRIRPVRTSTPPGGHGDARRRVSGRSAGSQDSADSFKPGLVSPISSYDALVKELELTKTALRKEENERSRERGAWEHERKAWERERATVMEAWERDRARLEEAQARLEEAQASLKEAWDRERATLKGALEREWSRPTA